MIKRYKRWNFPIFDKASNISKERIAMMTKIFLRGGWLDNFPTETNQKTLVTDIKEGVTKIDK